MIVFTPEQFRATHQAGITTSLALASAALQGIEAVAQLNMRAIWMALAESETALKGTTQSDNPAEILAQQVSASQRAAAKGISYVRELSDIATNTQAEWMHLAQGPGRNNSANG